MKAKLGVFLLAYSLFYVWLNISWVLPVTWLQYQRGLFWNIRDYLLWILPALLPYLILLKCYHRSKIICLLLVLTSIVASHLLRSQVVYSGALSYRAYFSKNAHLIFSTSLFGVVWYFVQAAQYYTIRHKELVSRARATELTFLQGQMSPHFLFNSLNNSYGLVYEQSPKALRSVQCLSNLMQYSYRDFRSTIPVQEEIDYIREYISMQQLRYEQDIPVRWLGSGRLDNINIHPLLLIPFIENAFKHGNIKTDGIEILLGSDGRTMTFGCTNNKVKNRKNQRSGIGLSNVKRRLELLYPGDHELQIMDRDDHFEIKLTVNV